jgi:hypothetical protein
MRIKHHSFRQADPSGGWPGLVGVLHAGYVIEVMDRIVDEVPRKRFNREIGAVAAAAGALPLTGGKRPETCRDRLGSLNQLGGNRGGILLAVAVGNRRRRGGCSSSPAGTDPSSAARASKVHSGQSNQI